MAFRGHEWVPDTRRLCVMNMLLHGIESLVGCEDSCAPQGEMLGKAHVILTNPPFNKMPSNTNRPDFTLTAGERVGPMPFLEHAIRSLKPGGRCAIVMPDNILFGDGTGAELRRFLMVNCNLHTILRLPTGVPGKTSGAKRISYSGTHFPTCSGIVRMTEWEKMTQRRTGDHGTVLDTPAGGRPEHAAGGGVDRMCDEHRVSLGERRDRASS